MVLNEEGPSQAKMDRISADMERAETERESLPTMDATYDPADNKIRLRSVSRLPKELYDRVKTAGYHWAPQQKLFVAPMWTPEREDLAIELCGELGDEDTSLVERAEERAERFEEYGEKRAEDANRAHAAVEAITDVTMGAPILIGHHSEKHARRDAERIRSGMAKAVRMWETSKYWEARAKGALRHAKYKEDPGVRHRRIKGLEADLRKHEKERSKSIGGIQFWSSTLTRDQALKIANYDNALPHGTWSALDKNEITVEEATKRAVEAHTRNAEWRERWIAHLQNRLTYERAMLGESGDIPVLANGFDVQVGGQILERHGWAVVLRVNKTGGEVNSYTVASRWGKMKIGIEDVKDYKPPSAEDAAKVQAATKLPPLVNYPGEGFRHMTKSDWDSRAKCSDFYRTVRVKETEKHGAHRQRMVPEGGGSYKDVPVYITDAPRKDPPAPSGPKPELPQALPPEPREPRALSTSPAARDKFAAMKDQLKAGVQVVSADQLFPTPPELCARMVRLAGVGEGDRVLEPSAGTGNIVQAIRARGGQPWCIEIDPRLAARLPEVVCIDFLEVVPSLVDAVVMNPPFKDGTDIKHILHARSFLKPGGRLVAICAGGPRQTEKLRPLCETWEALPEGTFAGTGVHAVLLTMRGSS